MSARGGTLRKTMDAMNEKHELKGANKLTKSTIHNYMKKELVGASPLRRGRQTQVPHDFYELLATHASTKQLEGQSEVKPRHLKNLIAAALLDTDLKSVDKEYIYKKFRKKCPHVVQPSKILRWRSENQRRRCPSIQRWLRPKQKWKSFLLNSTDLGRSY